MVRFFLLGENMKRCIILANGKPPKKNLIKKLQHFGFDTLFCADGGANSAMDLGFKPDYIIGDLDSVSPKVLKKYDGISQVIVYRRQDDTDVEKCLKYALKLKFKEVALLGGTGDRLDHSITNISIALKFLPRIKIYLFHEDSVLVPMTGAALVRTIPKEQVSIQAFESATVIKSCGLKYELDRINLPFGVRESQSNEANKDKFALYIENGKIILVRQLENWLKTFNLKKDFL